jgi:hypothetical protein
MTTVVAQRLIEATASLDAAQRALLSLWVNRGLNDEQIGRLVGVEETAIASRRAALVSALGRTLGLPESAVLEALQEIGRAAHADRTARRGAKVTDPAPITVAGPGQPVHGVAARAADGSPSRSRASRTRLLLFALAAAGALVVVILLVSGGRAPPTRPRTEPVSAARAGARRTAILVGLPGGPSGPHGQIVMSGAPGNQRLQAVITGLPVRGGGHYELWLYNSVLDSVPLAALSVPASTVTVALTVDPTRYLWVDVSFQPNGTEHHSGLSILRAPLPR